MEKNFYKIDEILFKTSRVIFSLILIVSLGGYCIQCLEHSNNNAFIIENQKGKEKILLQNYEVKEEVINLQKNLLKKKYKNLLKAAPTKDDWKKFNVIIQENGEEKEFTKKIDDTVFLQAKYEFLQSKYTDSKKIRKMTEAEIDSELYEYQIKFITFFLLSLIFPASFFALGYKFRKEEKEILSLLHFLEKTIDISMSDIIGTLGLKKPSILKYLNSINQYRPELYIYNQQTERIFDSRLKREYLHIGNCPSCGAITNQRVSIDFSMLPECRYCHTPFPVNFLNELRMKIFDNLQKQKVSISTPPEQKKEFKVWIFILLLLFCWPFALIYASTRDRYF